MIFDQMFDVRPPVYMRYNKESEVQTLEDLREFYRVMERLLMMSFTNIKEKSNVSFN